MPPILTVKVEKDGRLIKINADQTIEYVANGWKRAEEPEEKVEVDKIIEEAEALKAKEKAAAEAEAFKAAEINAQIEVENQKNAAVLEEAKGESKAKEETLVVDD